MKQVFTLLIISLCAACSACTTVHSAKSSNDWATMEKDTMYRMRGAFDICSVQAEKFVTKYPVVVTPIGDPGSACVQHDVFKNGDEIKVIANGSAFQLLFKQWGKEVPLDLLSMASPEGGGKVVLMHTKYKSGGGTPGNSRDDYDYYVMLRNDSTDARQTPKRYRIEAFPASGWGQPDFQCKPHSCDCERPDAPGNIGKTTKRFEAASGEGREPTH